MKALVFVTACLALSLGSVAAQEATIIGFPVGIGSSAGPDFYEPYQAQLQAIADTLKKYPLAKGIITGSADSEKYRRNNDAMNPALALGRAHTVLNYMMSHFGLQKDQLYLRTEEVEDNGPEFRFVRITIERELADMERRLTDIENTPLPVAPPKEIVTIREVPMESKQTEVKLHLGAGAATSPFGGLPIATAAVSWDERFFLEAIVGHTFWNDDYEFDFQTLNTKRRMLGGLAAYYPKEDLPLGLVGGWVRIEQMSRDYYKYVRLSEGLMLGLRWLPTEYLTITGVYNPSKEHTPEFNRSENKNDQFMLTAALNVSFGGAK